MDSLLQNAETTPMRLSLVVLVPWCVAIGCVAIAAIVGCGGHSGGVVSQAEYAAGSQQVELEQYVPDNAMVTPPDPKQSDVADRHDFIRENEFVEVAHQPLSTFSIDVDTASFSKVRQTIMDYDQLPSPGAIRIEEMINYFPYAYEAPAPGSDKVFADYVDVATCPWRPEHKLMRVALKGRDVQWEQKSASNIVLLVDTSGSMQAENRLPLLKRSLRILLKRLDRNDRIAIVAYAGTAGLVLPSTPGDQHQKIASAIDRLTPYGSTNGGAGIEAAYQIAGQNKINGGINRVLLCTDGDFNVGAISNDQLVRLIQRESKSGIDLSVLGFGRGHFNDSMLEEITGAGNGNYAFIDSSAEAHKVLVDQLSGTMMTIARDVKIQIEFNPKVVAGYRLLGYENRMLAAEDFRDDRVDAGELGAGHAVTALYELAPAGSMSFNFDRTVDPLKYSVVNTTADEQSISGAPISRKPASDEPTSDEPTSDELASDELTSDELATIKLRYKLPGQDRSVSTEMIALDSAESFEASDPDFRFATSVAAFGMVLRESPHAGSWELKDIKRVALSSMGNDVSGLRSQFLEVIDKADALTQAKHGSGHRLGQEIAGDENRAMHTALRQ